MEKLTKLKDELKEELISKLHIDGFLIKKDLYSYGSYINEIYNNLISLIINELEHNSIIEIMTVKKFETIYNDFRFKGIVSGQSHILLEKNYKRRYIINYTLND